MTIMTWLSILGLGSLITALIMWRIGKMDKASSDRDTARVEEAILIIRSVQAVGHLAEAVAVAQKRGSTNGETERALTYYTKAKDDINAYLLRQNAQRNHTG